MHSRLPSTKNLRAFEIVARLGSIKAAADFLAVTPSALSRRIQTLEEELGQALFQRDPRGLVLTEPGRQYAARLQSIFQSLAEATDAARTALPQRLRLLVPGLYATYLMPGLKIFEARHPGMQISVDIFPGALGSDVRVEEADMVVLYGRGDWPGWETLFLSPHAYSMPVCAPGYLPDGSVDDPRELAHYTWIRHPLFAHVWDNWCDAVGCPGLQPQRWFDADSGLTAREAARNGMGIWMGGGVPYRKIDPVIAGGELIPAHSYHAFLFDYGFYLAWRPQAISNPAAAAFCEWMRASQQAALVYYRNRQRNGQ
ncbi:MAG: LysR family transcriptional regulator [Proteobacteria bacterium]|nr:LysR family transcriptional regulator [Pseudomonadota bacterium]